jgi:hypothetical protein
MTSRVLILTAALAAACGPSFDSEKPKSPDEIVAEQEQLGSEQQKKARNVEAYDSSGKTDEEKKREWDSEYAGLELRRASRSAETCPGSVTEKAPKGKAKVTLVFANDGHVKDATVDDTYKDTAVGACVLRAMKAVIVKNYEGTERTVEYEFDLTGGKKSGPISGLSDSGGSSSEGDKAGKSEE